MKQLLEEIRALELQLSSLKQQLEDYDDGFIYICRLRCYGSVQWDTFKNSYCAQELCDEYTGDNGIVDVFTNNPKHGIYSYGEIKVLTVEEMSNLDMENISKSQAVLNWISRL